MRRLILFRHAKAIRATPGLRDRDRTLEPRGRDDAQLIGAYLAKHGFTPDRAIVSPSLRTRETFDCAALPVPADEDERIYEAAPEDILAAIADADDAARALLVVGHNPGIHELAMQLIATGDIEHRERLGEGFPTAGLAVIDFAVDAWRKLHRQGGRLERFVSPEILAPATD